MLKFIYKLADCLIEAKNRESNKYEEIYGCTKFTLPDFEADVEEISNQAGLLGTLALVDWGNAGALELGLTFNGVPDNAKHISPPEKVDIKIIWAEAYANKESEVDWDQYCVYATGFCKKFPGGDGERGSTRECEFLYALSKYKFTKNGETVIDYDPANYKVQFYNQDYGSKLLKTLQST